jgi:glutaminyl-peptide cyclotransferase
VGRRGVYSVAFDTRATHSGYAQGGCDADMSLDRVFSKRLNNLAAAVLALLLGGCASTLSKEGAADKRSKSPQETGDAIPIRTIKVLKSYPHDPDAFTQGFEYVDGFLYESTGEIGHSSVRKVELESGKVLQEKEVSPPHFGEGLTIFGGKVYQLAWLTKIGFVYDWRTFRKLREFHFDGEGWGLTHDDSSLILSDGTNRLRYFNPETFDLERTLDVYAGSKAVPNLNELERIGSDIYANVWHSDRIARIDSRSGEVVAWIDCLALASQEQKEPEAVLNGIAFDAARRRFFVTGKHWAHVFEIQIESNAF